MRLILVGAVIALLCRPWHQGLAQTSVNPDISVIPRFLLETHDGDPGAGDFTQPNFSFEELEIVFGAYLNPFARADVVLAIPGPDLEDVELGIEEVYATIVRGLPLDINLRVGKYRVDYGKINLVHPHAWAFITQPLSQEAFLGEEGLNDLGLSASVLLPTGDVYSKLTVDVLQGNAVAEAAGMADTTDESVPYAFSGRLMGFFPLGDESDMEIGLSSFTGIHDPYDNLRFWYVNADVKYKYRPGSYTSLTLQGEVLFNTRTITRVPGDTHEQAPHARTVNTWGAYGYADLQFERVFSIGGRFDWTQTPYSAEDKRQAVALFFGYYPVEETLGLRLQYQNTRYMSPGVDQTVNAIGLQLLFSLGPHKAHPF
jgi:hypothetical protein